jgi:N-acetylglutamate synthase/N-acetylornithine aminotransferase
MIAPQMATMIAVVCTDAVVPPPVLARALRSAVDASFHAVVVDGDMSTNDCVFALANGMAANAPVGEAGPDYESFCAALTDVCAELARDIAADGEGATKLSDRGDHPGAEHRPSPATSARPSPSPRW